MEKQKSKNSNKKIHQKVTVPKQKRKTKQEIMKEDIIEKLRKNPLISLVTQKVGISRATLYRWAREDIVFKDKIEEAQAMGRNMLNDVAISKLMVSIDRGDIRAIIFWLKHNHPNFIDPERALANELSINHGKLTIEQKEGILRRIKLWKGVREKSNSKDRS